MTRDSLHYRKLTDKSKDEEPKDEKKDDKDIERVETGDDEEILRSLALGN